MTQEEYKQLRQQAQQQMIADYHWLLSQPRQPRQWRCPRRWLIELVHDVNDRQEMLDDLHRPVQLRVLYEGFFQHIGTPMPLKPYKALNKLHAQEALRGISPDSITLYYMQEMQKHPPCRIIELLMEPKEGSSQADKSPFCGRKGILLRTE